MKPLLFFSLPVVLLSCQSADTRPGAMLYEPSAEFPYGRPNPDAPPELAQFDFMVGENDCSEERLNNATGEWDPGQRTWDAYYYINGYAIRDTGRSGAATNGNLRLFDTAAGQWLVTFYSMPAYSTGTWAGGMEGGAMVLRQPQKAPGTDLDGFSRLTFSNITQQGFDWVGEWVSADDDSVVFPFWRISCQKVD
ncbi:MAG: hypothetical protein O2971_15265 [Proteobacteria bacterium]|nr:hypothetical protein [Pseudomonadota bacterium]